MKAGDKRTQTNSKLLYLFGAATLFGLFQAARLYVAYNSGATLLISWGQAIVWALAEWYLWAVLSLLIYELTLLVKLSRKNIVKALIVHIPSAFLGSALLLLFYSFAYWGLKDLFFHQVGSSLTSWQQSFYSLLYGKMHSSVMTYIMITMGCYAVNYYRQMRDKEVQRVQLETQLTKANLSALKAQLQPHFLFNTLNTISALIHEDTKAADKMIADLSELLRTTLESVKFDKIPLRSELDFIDRYLGIQAVRFGDRISISKEIDATCHDAMVPNLILQPLVENAFQHGLADSLDNGQLVITVKKDGNRLKLTVVDNGPGLNHESKISENGGGVGLENTKGRLTELYGRDYSFVAESVRYGGFMVAIEIPFELNDNDRDAIK